MSTLRICLTRATNRVDVRWNAALGFGFLKAYTERLMPGAIEFLAAQSLEEAVSLRPDVLGVSSTSQDFDDATAMCSGARRAGIPVVVLGGFHITAFPDTLPVSADLGVLGEGEATFGEVVALLLRTGALSRRELAGVAGIVYRDESGRLRKTQPRPVIGDLDDIPIPDHYFGLLAGQQPYMFTSRGCPYRCSFCASSVYWPNVRFHSAERVLAELESLLRRDPSLSGVSFWDDLFAADRKRLGRIIDLFEAKGLNRRLSLASSVRANLVTDELCAQLRRLNYHNIGFGAESGSDLILKKLKDVRYSAADNQRALDVAKAHGLQASAGFVLGHYEETEENVHETYRFILKNYAAGKLARHDITILTPMPGTKLWQWAEARGIVRSQGMEWHRLRYLAMYSNNLKSIEQWTLLRERNRSLYLNEHNVPIKCLYQLIRHYEDKIMRGDFSMPGAPKPPVETGLAQYFLHRRQEIIAAVPESAMNILDVGCGGGALGKALKEAVPGRRVTGIELDEAAAAHAREELDAVYPADVESFVPPFEEGEFDCLVLADVVEHLRDPWAATRRLVRFLKPGGTVVASVPNVRRLTVVQELADKGRWEYRDEGILDRTHLRFFTKAMFKALLHEAGIGQLTVSNLNGEDLRQYAPAADRTVRIGRLRMQDVSPEEFEELSALQFLFVGTYAGVAAPAEGDAGSCLDDARIGEHPEEKPEGAPNSRSTDLTLNLSFVPPAQAPVASLTHQWGFYDDEGGWRWMSEAGQLLAPPSAKPSVFKADVACGKLSWYGGGSRNQTPLEVAVIVDGQTRQSLRFESDMQTLPIEQEIPASDKEVAIQLQSNKDYVPAENGINQDGRHLAVRLINPRLDAAQLPGRQNETPVSVNRATTLPVFQPSPASPAPPGSAWGGEGGAEALRFGDGFYDDEGGWRWMAGAGCLWVPRWATPATLSFRVGCAEESCYSAFPFDLTIYVGEESVYMHSIASSDKLLEIRLPIQPAAADVPVSLESRQVFVPARNGSSADVRELSVRLSHFSLKRADGAGSQPAIAPGATAGSHFSLKRADGAGANGDRPRVTGNGQSAARPAGGIKPLFKGPAKDEAYNHALAAYAADPTVMFELSSKCNFRCSYCRSASSQRTGSFMKREVFTHLVRQAKEITTRPLRLHVDGEPTLHPAFLDMALEANAAGHTLALATNGSALKPEFLQIDMCVVLNLSCSAKELASRSSIDYHRYHARIAKYLLAWKNGDSKQEFYFKIYTSGVERQNAANLQRKHRFAKKYVQDLGLGEGGTWQENGVITSFNCAKPGGGLFSLTIQPLAEGGCYPNADHHPCPGTGLPEHCGFCDSPWKVLAVLADGTVAFCCVDITGETGYTRPEELWEISLKDLWLKHPGIRQARLDFLAGRISRPICRKCLEASPHREMYLFPELFPYPPK